jgi:hypothetical protein
VAALAVRLGEITSLPVIELDKLFWRPGLTATPRDQWAAVQRGLTAQESWIMDGDLGPYDVLDIRLQAADTIVFLDFSPARCAWRAVRRSRERADFWWWPAHLSPAQPSAAPAGDRRPCRGRRDPRPPDPASGQPVHRADSLRYGGPALTTQADADGALNRVRRQGRSIRGTCG